MITTRACDLCHAALPAEVTRLTVRSGKITYLVQQRWKLQASRAGLQVLLICTDCSSFLESALAMLAAHHQALRARTPQPGANGDQRQVA